MAKAKPEAQATTQTNLGTGMRATSSEFMSEARKAFSKYAQPLGFQNAFRQHTDYVLAMRSPQTRNYHIAWIDIVESSKRASSTDQRKKIDILIRLIKNCDAFKKATAEARKMRDRKWWLWSKDTGDGYVLCFSGSAELPYSLAIELQAGLKKHNEKARSGNIKFSIRTGLHSGMLFLREDIIGRPDLSGDPLVFANRVCSLGEEWHILASEHFGKDVKKSGLFRQTIEFIGCYYSRHGRPIRVYNIFDENVGHNLPPLAPRMVSFDPAKWYKSEEKKFIRPNLPHIELEPLHSSKRGYHPSDFEFVLACEDFDLDRSLMPKVQRLRDWIGTSRRLWNGEEARLRKIERKQNGKIVLTFQKTQYFLGLLTNFFIDAKYKEWDQSLRAILAPDPLPSLEQSLSSNHLGVNCIIETTEKDPKVFLQKASRKVAIAPSKLGPSAAGALAFWHSGSLDLGSKESPSPFRGMMLEIIDELNLSPEDIVDMKLMMICRDLEAGGKPNAFFVAKTRLSFDAVRERRLEARERWESSDLVAFGSGDFKKINELVDRSDNLTGAARANLHYYLTAKQNA